MSILDVLARWGDHDVGKVRRSSGSRSRKQYRDKPDTDEADPEEDDKHVAMEKVSRDYIEQKKKFDDAQQKKDIREQLQKDTDAKKLQQRTDAGEIPDEPTGEMGDVAERYRIIKERHEQRKLDQGIDDQLKGRTRDENGEIVKPPKKEEVEVDENGVPTKPTGQMAEIGDLFIHERKKVEDAKTRQAINDSLAERKRNEDGKIVRPAKAPAVSTVSAKPVVTSAKPVVVAKPAVTPAEPQKKPSISDLTVTPTTIVAPPTQVAEKPKVEEKPAVEEQPAKVEEKVKPAEPVAEPAKVEEKPVVEEKSPAVEEKIARPDIITSPAAPAVVQAPVVAPPSLIGSPTPITDLTPPPTPEQTPPQVIVPEKPPEDVKPVTAPTAVPVPVTPAAPKPSLPLELDIPVSDAQLGVTPTPPPAKVDVYEGDKGLSTSFQESVSKDISVAGIPVPKATAAYDAANTALGVVQSVNKGVVETPFALRRLGAFMYKPIDIAAGTNLFERHNAATDKMERAANDYTRSFTKEPETQPERVAYAIGGLIVPVPGGAAAKTAGGVFRQMLAEVAVPGTFVRAGQSTAKTYAATVPALAAIAEGGNLSLEYLHNLQKTNPPVPNSVGDVEPRVTSIPGSEAKAVQQQINVTKESWSKTFAEANYVTPLTAGAIAGLTVALAGLGVHRTLARPVGGRIIRDPTHQTPDLSPVSVTTPREVVQTLGQDANAVLASQARRAGNPDLAVDIYTQTRGGVRARLEYAHDTGTVEIPNHGLQLSVSPKSLGDHVVSRPPAEQEPLARALATLDQADHARINRGAGMPAQPDIAEARRVIALPENASTVAANAEVREAILTIGERSGRYTAAETARLRAERPNYARVIETKDFVSENGVMRPMTRLERRVEAMRTKASRDANDGVEYPNDLDLAHQRTQVFGPNQRVDPVLANLSALQDSIEFAHKNDAIRRYVESVATDPEMARSFVRLRPGQEAPHGSGLVQYWENGVAQRFAAEKTVADGLRFDPYKSNKWLSTMRNMFQKMTTGVLAPWFASTSMVMESMLGAITRQRGMRLGWIDQGLQWATGGRLAYGGDYLGTIAAATTQGLHSVRSASTLRHAQNVERAILADPTLAIGHFNQAVPGFATQVARGLASGHVTAVTAELDGIRNTYAQSAKGIAQRTGALHSSQSEFMRTIEDINHTDTRNAFIDSFGPTQGAQTHDAVQRAVASIAALPKTAAHAVGEVYDLNKLALIEANKPNLPRGPMPSRQLNDMTRELASEARNLGGDLGKRGRGFGDSGYTLRPETGIVGRTLTALPANRVSGAVLDSVRDGTPFYNAFIQGMARGGEGIRRNPVGTPMAIFNGIITPTLLGYGMAEALGPEYVDYMLNRREEYRKSGYIYIPKPWAKPEDGWNLRIDPFYAVFGYPTIEAIASVFGTRQRIAKELKQEYIPEEEQGIKHALINAVKEMASVPLPLPAQAALGYFAHATSRGLFDQTYARKAEQASGAQGTGLTASSALDMNTQMLLEAIGGTATKMGVNVNDAMYSADKGKGFFGNVDSALQAGGKQLGHELAQQVPGGSFFGAVTPYNASGTVLAERSRQKVSALKKIIKAVETEQKGLLQTKSNRPDISSQTPNLRQGYLGEVTIPPEVKEKLAEVKGINSELGLVFMERTRITRDQDGLRGVNAGNIGRHKIVPLNDPDPKGAKYTILSTEALKKEIADEAEAKAHPTLTPKTGVVAAELKQRPRPLEDRLDMKIDRGPDLSGYKSPTLAQVAQLKKDLNQRRYELDKELVSTISKAEQAGGFDILKMANSIKFGNGYTGSDAEDED